MVEMMTTKKLIYPILILYFLIFFSTGTVSAQTSKSDDSSSSSGGVPKSVALGLDLTKAIIEEKDAKQGILAFTKDKAGVDLTFYLLGEYEKLLTGQLTDEDAIIVQAKDKVKKTIAVLSKVGEIAEKVGAGTYDEAIIAGIDLGFEFIEHPAVGVVWAATKMAYESYKEVKETKAQLEIEQLYNIVDRDRRLKGVTNPASDSPPLIPENAETVDYFFNKYLITNDEVRRLVKTYVKKVIGDEWPEQTWSDWIKSSMAVGSYVDTERSAEIEMLATEFRNKARSWIAMLIKDINKQAKLRWAEARVRQELIEFKKFVERMKPFERDIDKLFQSFKELQKIKRDIPKYKELLEKSKVALEQAKQLLPQTSKIRELSKMVWEFKLSLMGAYSGARLVGEMELYEQLLGQWKSWDSLEKEINKKFETDVPQYAQQEILHEKDSSGFDPVSYFNLSFQIPPMSEFFEVDSEKIITEAQQALDTGDFVKARSLMEKWDNGFRKAENYFNKLEPEILAKINEISKEISKYPEHSPERCIYINRGCLDKGYALRNARENILNTLKFARESISNYYNEVKNTLKSLYDAYVNLGTTRQEQFIEIYKLVTDMLQSLPIDESKASQIDFDYFGLPRYVDNGAHCVNYIDYLEQRKAQYGVHVGVNLKKGDSSSSEVIIKSIPDRIESEIRRILGTEWEEFGGPEGKGYRCFEWLNIWKNAAQRWLSVKKPTEEELRQMEILSASIGPAWMPIGEAKAISVIVDVKKLVNAMKVIDSTAKESSNLIGRLKTRYEQYIREWETDTSNRHKSVEWLREKKREVNDFLYELAQKGIIIFQSYMHGKDIEFYKTTPDNMVIIPTPYRRYAIEKDFQDTLSYLNRFKALQFIKEYFPAEYEKLISLASGKGINRAREENFIPPLAIVGLAKSTDMALTPIYMSDLSRAETQIKSLIGKNVDYGTLDKVLSSIEKDVLFGVLERTELGGWRIRNEIFRGEEHLRHPLGERYLKLIRTVDEVKDAIVMAELQRKREEEDKKRLEEEKSKAEEELRKKVEQDSKQREQGIEIIRQLYNQFKSAYESRNDSLVMSFLGDSWSAGDGTTLADLQNNLRRTFKTFDEVRFNLQNLKIDPMSSDVFRISYDVTITSRIYKRNIKHEEKSSVVEEVTVDSNSKKAKISRTISGRFWYIK
ncbi:hypothetical protein [Thermodesulfovibrio yellowstonii]|uniref:hypothetical protein n=1 Tax=Thermodesulfovibrio yellowstonii TaxID=28262 RepID=UPI003F832671